MSSHKATKTQENDQPQGLDKRRALLLAILVVVITGAVIFLLSGGESKQPAEAVEVDDGVVEVSPVLPTGNISSASWRSAEQRRADLEAEQAEDTGTTSILDQVKWGEDEKQRRYDKSVEKTVHDIQGLGIYVAPLEDGEKDKK